MILLEGGDILNTVCYYCSPFLKKTCAVQQLGGTEKTKEIDLIDNSSDDSVYSSNIGHDSWTWYI